MKKQIRHGVFETNSSSVHSLTMCTDEEFTKWENGEVLFWKYRDKFGTRDEIIKELKSDTTYDGRLSYPDINWDDPNRVRDIFKDECIQTFEEFFDDEWFETFSTTYTTPGGEEIVAFGYYGHD